jgi:hypothetical protein
MHWMPAHVMCFCLPSTARVRVLLLATDTFTDGLISQLVTFIITHFPNSVTPGLNLREPGFDDAPSTKYTYFVGYEGFEHEAITSHSSTVASPHKSSARLLLPHIMLSPDGGKESVHVDEHEATLSFVCLLLSKRQR